MKARYYDPEGGSFISQDSYLGEPGTPPSLHRYLYAFSNPTMYIDPDGYESVSTTLENKELNASSGHEAFGWRFLSNLYHVSTLDFSVVHDPQRDAYDNGDIS
ncbi:RHS repeat-associated core domain-containing protein [Agarilytica rhodophyticola]|uniref:RHS repeat-associated core domain-containing protein n=1 Tax=Agarilytica rhodophyticola TaxID=1737490 RepID=UPI000B349336|nr:RHS repeat-associated core domain-containing protein [Agarilytica rhodophyticola]